MNGNGKPGLPDVAYLIAILIVIFAWLLVTYLLYSRYSILLGSKY